MFVNEYVMDRRRYDKWATPKFWRLPIFYVYCLIFVAGVFGWIYFDKADAPARWQTIGAFLTFVAVYRGVFSSAPFPDTVLKDMPDKNHLREK